MRKVLVFAISLASISASMQTAFASNLERTITWRWWPPGFVTTWAPPQPRGIIKSNATGNNNIGQPVRPSTNKKMK